MTHRELMDLIASMGPLFFRAENDAAGKGWATTPPSLQWGRSFSERRTRRGPRLAR